MPLVPVTGTVCLNCGAYTRLNSPAMRCCDHMLAVRFLLDVPEDDDLARDATAEAAA